MIDYDPHSWLDHFFDIKGSMVREIVWRFSGCVLWSVAVVGLTALFEAQFVPIHWQLSLQTLGLIGVALGMLLVFRTNSSYDRWWEARRLWGSIINETRNLGRASHVYLGADRAALEAVLDWTSAFAHATMNRLRGRTGLGSAAQRLPADEVAEVLGSEHPPLAIARRITSLLAEARDRGVISDYVMLALDQNVQLLVDYLGACERIQKTPLPFAYVVHVRRVLVIYCYLLPLALVNEYAWGTVLATAAVSYVFFGIEEIGVEIEEPFGTDDNDLPLERYCEMIDRNLRAMGTADRAPSARLTSGMSS